jgi:molybdopterin molybdotransferase
MMGYSEVDRPRVEAIVEGDLVRRFDGKVHFARVVVSRIGTEYRVSSAGGQGSHQLSAMAGADGLAVLPDGEGMTDGEIVEVLLLR